MKEIPRILLTLLALSAPLFGKPEETAPSALRRIAGRYDIFASTADYQTRLLPESATFFRQRAAAYREVAALLRSEANDIERGAPTSELKDAVKAADEAAADYLELTVFRESKSLDARATSAAPAMNENTPYVITATSATTEAAQ